jgi:hypothetical protein
MECFVIQLQGNESDRKKFLTSIIMKRNILKFTNKKDTNLSLGHGRE